MSGLRLSLETSGRLGLGLGLGMKGLGVGIEGHGLGIGVRQLGLMHIPAWADTLLYHLQHTLHPGHQEAAALWRYRSFFIIIIIILPSLPQIYRKFILS